MQPATSLTTDALDFELPEALIAQQPAPTRGASRLMVLLAGEAQPREIGRFDETFLAQLRSDDLVIANDARVLHARVPVARSTGGVGEVLLLAPVADDAAEPGRCTWTCMARPARKYAPDMFVDTISGDAQIRFCERTSSQTWTIELPCALDDVPAWLLQHGELPLPPYVTANDNDPQRYQTVHARVDGSVAAPTAGLHFDEQMWERVAELCEVADVTLHVGAGTFLPVSEGPLSAHVMHHERYEVPPEADAAIRAAIANGRRIVAIGTTSTRVLEHVYGDAQGALRGSTDLFILPGHRWACVGAMLTNFHLPKSTLIALVMAFHGEDATRAAYTRAIEAQMRFYSFGDAMFIHGPPVTASAP